MTTGLQARHVGMSGEIAAVPVVASRAGGQEQFGQGRGA